MAEARVELLQFVSLGLFALALWSVAYRLFSMRPAPVPTLGSRGERRQRAIARSPIFRSLDPIVRQAGVWIGQLPLQGLRAPIERKLAEAGYFLGLTPDEFIVLQTLSTAAGAALGGVVGTALDSPSLGPFVGAALGFAWPLSLVLSERDRRFREVARRLPVEIDLAAMCMHAGLDFPGAIALIVDQHGDGDEVLREELARILQELELGHTRATALRNFAARVPCVSVRDFVGAVIQAEEKGTPLAEVLRIQAAMLRMRRSILAEEAASRASVFMSIPLMLLLCSVMILLLGPMLVKMMDMTLL